MWPNGVAGSVAPQFGPKTGEFGDAVTPQNGEETIDLTALQQTVLVESC